MKIKLLTKLKREGEMTIDKSKRMFGFLAFCLK